MAVIGPSGSGKMFDMKKTSNSQGTFFVCEGLLSVFNVNLPASISNLNKIEKQNS